jgi:hypothetical protein
MTKLCLKTGCGTGNDIFDKVVVGDRFITPFDKLEYSKRRPVYSPSGLKKME